MPHNSLALTRRAPWLLVLCVGVIVWADVLFFHHPLGWSTALFGAALVLALLSRQGETLRTWPGRIILLLCLGLILALIEMPSVLAVLMGAVAVVSLAMVDRCGWTPATRDWLARWGRFVESGWLEAILDARRLRRRQLQRQRQHTTARIGCLPRAALWLIPVILSAIFVALFALANPIIADWLANIRENLRWLLEKCFEFATPLRMLLWLIVGLWGWALLRRRVRRWARPFGDDSAALGLASVAAPGHALVVRCLLLFNLVFAVQTVLDIYFLWGGATLPKAMSYAHYAHRGSYPLVATALLAAVFMLLAFRPHGPAEKSVWARRLVYAWIIQNVFLVVSAAWRLGLYVQFYSLSRWRIAAAVWMLVVALGLVWIGWRILSRRSNVWLLRINVATALAVLVACCFVNFDGFIAGYNVLHCREMGAKAVPLDFDYLAGLGPDALPALVWLAEHTDEPAMAKQSAACAAKLRGDLDQRLCDWRGWTWRRHRLAQIDLRPLTDPRIPQPPKPPELAERP